jgi:hypothetical protein
MFLTREPDQQKAAGFEHWGSGSISIDQAPYMTMMALIGTGECGVYLNAINRSLA